LALFVQQLLEATEQLLEVVTPVLAVLAELVVVELLILLAAAVSLEWLLEVLAALEVIHYLAQAHEGLQPPARLRIRQERLAVIMAVVVVGPEKLQQQEGHLAVQAHPESLLLRSSTNERRN
jgi:hypothetical protein